MFYRGDPESPRDEVTPGALAKFVSLKIDTKTPEQKRRLALADWIVDNAAAATLSVDYAECFSLDMSRGDCNPDGVA